MNTLQFPSTGTNLAHNIVFLIVRSYCTVCTLLYLFVVFACMFDRENRLERMRWGTLIKIDAGNQSTEQLALTEWAESVDRLPLWQAHW